MPRGLRRTVWLSVLVFCLAVAAGRGQTQPAQAPPTQKTQPQQDIPDAPSAVRPPPVFPTVPPTSEGAAPPASNPANPENAPTPQSRPATPPEPLPEAPPTNTDTTFPGDAVQGTAGTGFTIPVRVNDVMIPVRVTDDSGRLVYGLQAKDFAVYDDGQKQKLDVFYSSPVVLSAAVIIDLGMPDEAVQKVNRTFSALQGAFSPYDEVAIYTYSSTVAKMADFDQTGKKLTAVLDGLQTVTGRPNGPPILDGPIGPGGPVINGIPIDPNQPHVSTPPQESHVLNDAILRAALDLNKRDRGRRKIIFVISDGREIHSSASYSAVLKVLLTNGVAVYGVGVGGAAMPGYKTVERLHLPRLGYSDILPKYVNATAGEFFSEISRNSIETAYAHAIGDARNQYTLGYAAHLTPSEAYHEIEVTVDRPGLSVYAKHGYYPAPGGR